MTYFILHLDAYENGDDKNFIQFERNYVNLLKSVTGRERLIRTQLIQSST